MTIRCPVCRADNDAGPTCRRCKADLAPLFALAERRSLALRQAAVGFLLRREFARALACWREANAFRPLAS